MDFSAEKDPERVERQRLTAYLDDTVKERRT
jgi:hypothetical protein